MKEDLKIVEPTKGGSLDDIKAEEVSMSSFGTDVDAALNSENARNFIKAPDNKFVRGSLVSRSVNSIDGVDNRDLGICTGVRTKDEFGNDLIGFTDGEFVRESECVLLEDVNKEVFRYIASEEKRLRADLEDLSVSISLWIQRLIEND